MGKGATQKWRVRQASLLEKFGNGMRAISICAIVDLYYNRKSKVFGREQNDERAIIQKKKERERKEGDKSKTKSQVTGEAIIMSGCTVERLGVHPISARYAISTSRKGAWHFVGYFE